MHTIHKLSLSHRRRITSRAAPTWYDNDGAIAGCWAAYQPKSATSYLDSLTDLSGNGHDATDPGGAATPAWAASTGWQFDGTNTYLRTTFVPADDQSQSVIVQFSDLDFTNKNRYLAGCRNSTGNRRFYIAPELRVATSNVVYYGNGYLSTNGPRLRTGNLCAAGDQGYRNGVPDGGSIGPWSAATALAVFIGGLNFDGSLDDPMDGYIQAIAIYDVALSAADVATIAALMAAL